MENYLDTPVGQIVKDDYRKADVFKKYKIDFCCKGKLLLSDACESSKVDTNEIENALVDIDNAENMLEVDFTTWELDRLVNHIIDKHHAYVTEALPVLFQYTQKVAKVHGERKPYAVDIFNNFYEISKELQQHMHKEEMILFPFIVEMAKAKKEGVKIDQPMFGTVGNPISMMEAEHESAGEIMFKIKELTDNYTPPKDACMTHQVTYHKLKEFEDDLFEHIHLENNILFPKAIELEKELI